MIKLKCSYDGGTKESQLYSPVNQGIPDAVFQKDLELWMDLCQRSGANPQGVTRKQIGPIKELAKPKGIQLSVEWKAVQDDVEYVEYTVPVGMTQRSMMEEAAKLAGTLYESYCGAVGGKAFNGEPLPPWEEFSEDPNKQIQAMGWILVGTKAIEQCKGPSAVIEIMKQCEKSLPWGGNRQKNMSSAISLVSNFLNLPE